MRVFVRVLEGVLAKERRMGERVALMGRLLLVLLGVCEYSAGLGVMEGEVVWQAPGMLPSPPIVP